MFLVMSGDFVGQELRSEFGSIPPSFLPLGNRRLFQYQFQLIPDGEATVLSLPESFRVGRFDQQWLNQRGVQVVRVPDGLGLGAAFVATMNLVESALDEPLRVLYGDTLIDPLPLGDDLIVVSSVEDNYDWAVVTGELERWLDTSEELRAEKSQDVVTGYFCFSRPRQLIRYVTQCHWNFLDGIGRYHAEVGLEPVRVTNWLDFGHVNTFFRSKARFTTQRAFNDMTITPGWVEKSSSHQRKIVAEANWFEQLPPMIRQYTPQYLGRHGGSEGDAYRLEYLHHTALNELYVFGATPEVAWRQIFHACIEFLKECERWEAPPGSLVINLEKLFGAKTLVRLKEFSESRKFSLSEKWDVGDGVERRSLMDLIDQCEPWLPKDNDRFTLMHGDFCFSNILYDFRTHRIKTFDPRGLSPDGQVSIYGNVYYDIAKLSHSVLGLYDWLIAGYFKVEIERRVVRLNVEGSRRHRRTRELFVELVRNHFGLEEPTLYAMQVHLFLSMLPLHADDPHRQNGLLANAFRLSKEMEKCLS